MNASIFVLTDLRVPILLAAVHICWRTPDSYVVISKSLLTSNDYGSSPSRLYKLFKLAILKLIVSVKLIETDSALPNPHDNSGVLSSLTSRTLDHLARPTDYPHLSKQYVQLAAGACSIVKYLSSVSPRQVFLYNGRFASVRAVADYCRINNIRLWYLEYGNIPYHFTIQRYPIHDYASQCRDCIALYDYSLHTPSIYNLAEAVDHEYNLLVHNRFAGDIQANSTYDLGIFLTSPHELQHAPPPHGNFSDLSYCIEQLSLFNSDVRAVIKMHPNMTSDPSWPVLFNSLSSIRQSYPSLTVLPPTARESALSLIAVCSTCVIPFSSLAVLSHLSGRKTVCHPNSFYYPLLAESNHRRYSSDQQRDFLLTVHALRMYLNQEPYHPVLSLIYRTFASLDIRISSTQHRGPRPVLPN